LSENRALERKRIGEVFAPPLFWGPWAAIFTQFGVAGPDSDKHVTKLRVSFRPAARSVAAFGVQIRGGDAFVDTTGPGSEVVTITGNVATSIEIRAKSFGQGQPIDVDVRQVR